MLSLWQTWLKVALCVLVLLGIDMALFGTSALFDFINGPINQVIFGTAAIDPATLRYQQFAYSVFGATTAGWGVTMAFIAFGPLVRLERWAWFAIVEGLLVWFVLDTGISLWLGVTANALLNLALALALAIPLAGIWPHLGARERLQAA